MIAGQRRATGRTSGFLLGEKFEGKRSHRQQIGLSDSRPGEQSTGSI
jgi:hypothetical protein